MIRYGKPDRKETLLQAAGLFDGLVEERIKEAKRLDGGSIPASAVFDAAEFAAKAAYLRGLVEGEGCTQASKGKGG